MHAVLDMGCQNVHVDAVLEADEEPTITPICEDCGVVCSSGVCGHHGDLLCNILPTIFPVLGDARGEHAMCNIPTLLDHAGGFQHFIRRSYARHSGSFVDKGPDEENEESVAGVHNELGRLHNRGSDTEQSVQLCLAADHHVPDLVYPRGEHIDLCCQSRVPVATSAKDL